jgi:hypothetical protein
MSARPGSNTDEPTSTASPETPSLPEELGKAGDHLKANYDAARDAGELEWAEALCESDDPQLRQRGRAIKRQHGVEAGGRPLGGGALTTALRKALGARRRVSEWSDHKRNRGQMGGRLFQLVAGAVVLGLTIIVLQLMILISGEFSAAIDGGGPFDTAANSTETNGNTAYEIMSVATLVIPVVVVVGLLVGAFMSGRISGGGRLR